MIMENKKIISYDKFCFDKQCPEYIKWDCGEGICISCKKIGQSYFINKYPKDCNFLEEIKVYETISS